MVESENRDKVKAQIEKLCAETAYLAEKKRLFRVLCIVGLVILLAAGKYLITGVLI